MIVEMLHPITLLNLDPSGQDLATLEKQNGKSVAMAIDTRAGKLPSGTRVKKP